MPLFQSPRLPGLDTLRAVAILAVMLYHLQSSLPSVLAPVAHFGWIGVDLFFVLSGYLIGSQLLNAHQRGAGAGLWRFYRRRLFRILPAYLVVLFLYFAVPVWREADNISPLRQFLTFTENLFVDYSRNHAFSHVWSLCIEEQFYLLLPLIVLVMMRRPSLCRTVFLIASLVAAGIAIRTFVFFHVLRPLGVDNADVAYIEQIYYPTWSRMDGLLAGVTLALIRIFRPTWWRSLSACGHATFAAGLALFALSLWLFDNRFTSQTGAAEWSTFIGFPLLSLALALIVASSISANGLLKRIPIPGAQGIATLAYSLYLTHKEMAHLAQTYLPSLTANPDSITLCIFFITCLTGAAVLHYAVERPFMALRDRLDGTLTDRIEERMRLDPAL